jgi:hypothetical protein
MMKTGTLAVLITAFFLSGLRNGVTYSEEHAKAMFGE